MSTDPDIHFGDLEEEQPDVELRPDRNAHFAVVAYGEPEPDELPIFIDLDVLIEMESHALTDTSVELGGVMLGGQLHDEEGQPYVLVQDSVRAQHYEATKGSFKFTHDTWGQITKDRDEFPSDWDMVGWYHTHPDWGVFLSGMDMFICDNFFNKPLDVALVIDPCRQDRGFFQWTGDPRQRKARVGGFYVIASRHRQAELEQFVAELEGGYTMRTDPNMRAGYNVSGGGGAPTIVNITEQRPGWMGQAVVMSIVFQTLVLLMFGYMAFVERPEAQREAPSDEQKLLAEKERELEIRSKELNAVVEKFAGDKDFASQLQERTVELEKLKNKLAVAEAGVPELLQERTELAEQTEELADEKKQVAAKLDAARKERDEAKASLKLLEKAVLDGDVGETWYGKYLNGKWLAIGAMALVFVAAAGYFAYRGMAGQDEFPEDLVDPPPPEGNFSEPQPPQEEVDYEDEPQRDGVE